MHEKKSRTPENQAKAKARQYAQEEEAQKKHIDSEEAEEEEYEEEEEVEEEEEAEEELEEEEMKSEGAEARRRREEQRRRGVSETLHTPPFSEKNRGLNASHSKHKDSIPKIDLRKVRRLYDEKTPSSKKHKFQD